MSDESANASVTPDPQSIEGLFLTALGHSSPEEREAFLNEACGDDAERRRRIEALLRAYDDAGSFLEHSPVSSQIGDSFNLEFLTPSDDPGLIGTLGPYEVFEVLGRGGMGIVFRARDPKLNRVVAIKVLAPELAANPNARRRFLREAQAAAAISHPHVVTIHAVDDGDMASGGRQSPVTSDSQPTGGLHPPLALPYLVMECIVGQTLQQKLDKQGSLRLTETLRIGQQVACGLAAAHKQGLIHRDIKPANILLENGVERVKITDFGLARAADDVSITRTGEVSGTPQYMSPEQAQGDPIDHRSDLFSLGCVLYAMCTGRSPFRATSFAAAIRRVCDDTPRPIAEINPEVPTWLIEIVDRLLEKQPDARLETAEEVSQLLGQHLSSVQSSLVTPHPTLSSAPPHRNPVDASATKTHLANATGLRRPSRSIIVSAALILLAPLFIWGLGTLSGGRMGSSVEEMTTVAAMVCVPMGLLGVMLGLLLMRQSATPTHHVAGQRFGHRILRIGMALALIPWLVISVGELTGLNHSRTLDLTEIGGLLVVTCVPIGLLAILIGWVTLSISRGSRSENDSTLAPSPVDSPPHRSFHLSTPQPFPSQRDRLARWLIFSGLAIWGALIAWRIAGEAQLVPLPAFGQTNWLWLPLLLGGGLIASGMLLGRYVLRPFSEIIRAAIGPSNPKRYTQSPTHADPNSLHTWARRMLWLGLLLITLPGLPIVFGFLIQEGDLMEFGGRLVPWGIGLGLLALIGGWITKLVAHSTEGPPAQAISPWRTLGWGLIGFGTLAIAALVLPMAQQYERASREAEKQAAEARMLIEYRQDEHSPIRVPPNPTYFEFPSPVPEPDSDSFPKVRTLPLADDSPDGSTFDPFGTPSADDRLYEPPPSDTPVPAPSPTPAKGERTGSLNIDIQDDGLLVALRRKSAFGGFVPGSEQQVSDFGQTTLRLHPGEYAVLIRDQLFGFSPNRRLQTLIVSEQGAELVVRRILDNSPPSNGEESSLRSFVLRVFTSPPRSFLWDGQKYKLSSSVDRLTVWQLLHAHDQGKPQVDEQTLLQSLLDIRTPGSDSRLFDEPLPTSLAEAFEKAKYKREFTSPAPPVWGNLVVPGEQEGTYCLKPLTEGAVGESMEEDESPAPPLPEEELPPGEKLMPLESS